MKCRTHHNNTWTENGHSCDNQVHNTAADLPNRDLWIPPVLEIFCVSAIAPCGGWVFPFSWDGWIEWTVVLLPASVVRPGDVAVDIVGRDRCDAHSVVCYPPVSGRRYICHSLACDSHHRSHSVKPCDVHHHCCSPWTFCVHQPTPSGTESLPAIGSSRERKSFQWAPPERRFVSWDHLPCTSGSNSVWCV